LKVRYTTVETIISLILKAHNKSEIVL